MFYFIFQYIFCMLSPRCGVLCRNLWIGALNLFCTSSCAFSSLEFGTLSSSNTCICIAYTFSSCLFYYTYYIYWYLLWPGYYFVQDHHHGLGRCFFCHAVSQSLCSALSVQHILPQSLLWTAFRKVGTSPFSHYSQQYQCPWCWYVTDSARPL